MRTKPVVTQTIYILPDLLQEFNPIWTDLTVWTVKMKRNHSGVDAKSRSRRRQLNIYRTTSSMTCATVGGCSSMLA
jgi:hypothetical protein